MSEALTVHTHFQDLSELAAGLADRVEDGRVILYGPTNYETGETIPFAILLADGSAVIEGHGVVAAAVDGGEDRDPAFRYDVVLTELQLDARSEIMFARILMAGEEESRETALPEEEDVGFEQVDVSGDAADMGGFQDESTAVADLSAHAAAMMPSGGRPAEPDAEEDEDVPVSAEVEPEAFSVTTKEFVAPTGAADDVDDMDDARKDASDPYGDPYDDDAPATSGGTVLVDGAMAPPTVPAAPAGFTVARLVDVGLSRPVHAATWWPEPSPRQDPEPATGAFQYTGALPIPNEPPRPDLDPSQRITPAPHPIAEGSAPAPVQQALPSARATVNEHAETFVADDVEDVSDGDYNDEPPGEDEAVSVDDDELDVDME